MNRILKAVGFCALVLSMLACAVIPTVPGLPGAGPQPTSLAALWPDVPAMDGLTLATDLQAPPFVHILLTLVTKQILGNGTDSGDWVDFTTTKTADDVKAFYTPQLMATNGWDPSDKSTCINGSDQGVAQVGAVCFFTKHSNGYQIGLIILASQPVTTTATNVFFVRVQTLDTTPTPTLAK
jgi:hypothetical protein